MPTRQFLALQALLHARLLVLVLVVLPQELLLLPPLDIDLDTTWSCGCDVGLLFAG